MKMSELAELAGVSIATVSRVLNNPEKVRSETRDKILKLIEQTNFVANGVARGLAVNSMKTIGVLVTDIRDLYFASVTYTVERQFTDLGYNVLLCNTGGELGEKKKYLRIMLEKQVDGLILVGSVFKERSSNSHILAVSEKIPVVMVNSFLAGKNIYSVLCDDAAGVKEAVQYLVNEGHRHIYYFNDIKSVSGVAKMNGFIEAMLMNKLNEKNILEISRSLEGGRAGVSELIANKVPFSAIICGEDITAIGAIKELNRLGYRVPEDVSVIGYNNSFLTDISIPTLTSVNNMVESMAKSSVQTLYEVLQGEDVPKKIVLTPSLIIRESTAAYSGLSKEDTHERTL